MSVCFESCLDCSDVALDNEAHSVVGGAKVDAIGKASIHHLCKEVATSKSLGLRRISTVRENLSELKTLYDWDCSFTKRITSQERACLERLMASLSDETVERVLERDWEGISKSDISAAILKSYFEQRIDEYQASKLFLILRCKDMGKFKVRSIQNNRDWDLFIRAFKGFDTTRLQRMAQEIEFLAAEESEFFTFVSKYSKDEFDDNIANFAINHLSFSFGFLKHKNKILNLVLPPKFLQRVLQAEFGENAIQVVPVLGFSPVEKFSDYSKRIVGIPFDHTETEPQKIHNLFSTHNNCAMYLHDSLYHAIVESANPHRAIWTEIALKVKEKDREQGISLLDRDCYEYVTQKDSKKAFWTQVERHFFNNKEILKYISSEKVKWESAYKTDLSLSELSHLKIG
jgi:hypothetical protein